MIASVNTGVLLGLDAQHVLVEVDMVNGLPAINIVGLPDAAIREARERVRSAISNSEYEFPLKRITVNLAPADTRKEGPAFDLPIALGILSASGVIAKEKLDPYLIAGELSLRGDVKSTRGILALTLLAKRMNKNGVIVPIANKDEAALIEGIEVIAVGHLLHAVAHLTDKVSNEKIAINNSQDRLFAYPDYSVNYSEIQGQVFAKRAIEIAAAGGHNLLMIGPPGSGKTMLAKRIPTIMPPLELEESIELTKIASAAGTLGKNALVVERPFRDPHHSISYAGLLGGGRNPRPGEVTLSYLGVLFLDELPEFDRSVLEVLRQPMENGDVTISRASGSIKFPVSFMMVAGMNPCQCGYLGDIEKECVCSSGEIRRYRSKISGPLLDRIDIFSEVARLTSSEIANKISNEGSKEIRERVTRAREKQRTRFETGRIASLQVNAQMTHKEIRQHCKLKGASAEILKGAYERSGMSARGYMKVLKVARTIADLSGSNSIEIDHISEALQLRTMDGKYFNG